MHSSGTRNNLLDLTQNAGPVFEDSKWYILTDTVLDEICKYVSNVSNRAAHCTHTMTLLREKKICLTRSRQI